ncbi:solute carrier family 25 member 35-like [Mytilus californianus]|uniref:solute carrier family 25 member 35-like n=1 Tax=Mytilus californianus TaxID=6549 RepID=UPI002248392F|nr:solute carrier family 25 member 35-like [Mytilus californianus]
MPGRPHEEMLLGGLAAVGAGFFTNPLEVVKTRMQLQGELKARGHYAVHYRNSLHAVYTIFKSDGIIRLQSGLVPALWYQLFMNGMRLGSYQIMTNLGLLNGSDGKVSFLKSILGGASAGCVGAIVGSPFYMVKTQLQSRSASSIAVGYQHRHGSMMEGFTGILKEHGIGGLWRGVTGAMLRVMIGSAAQLTTFSTAKEYILSLKVFSDTSILIPFCASIISGIVLTVFMTPPDVMCTRLYNQGVDANGKGLYYKNLLDCGFKIMKKEGPWGFYKGWGPSFIRIAPHSVLSLMFWDQLRKTYERRYHKQLEINIPDSVKSSE